MFERRRLRARPRVVATMVLLAVPGGAVAQRPAGSIELELGAAALSAGLGPWWSAQLRASRPAGSADLLNVELLQARRFGANGTYLMAGERHLVGPWFADLNVGHGFGAFFLPALRVDAAVGRAVGPVVIRLGVGWVDQTDAHRDRSLLLGASWYPAPGWVLQGDARLSRSDPGGVGSSQQAVALHRMSGRNTWVARFGWGREAWQRIGPDVALVDFPFREASLSWRRELRAGWGPLVRAEAFHAPHYERAGLSAGLFHSLP